MRAGFSPDLPGSSRVCQLCPPEKPRYRIRTGEFRATFRIIQDRLVICVVAVGNKGIFEY